MSGEDRQEALNECNKLMDKAPLEADTWFHMMLAVGLEVPAARQFSYIFRENDLELDMLDELTHELLIQMGITKAGHRIKLLRLKPMFLSSFQDTDAGGLKEYNNDVTKCSNMPIDKVKINKKLEYEMSSSPRKDVIGGNFSQSDTMISTNNTMEFGSGDGQQGQSIGEKQFYVKSPSKWVVDPPIEYTENMQKGSCCGDLSATSSSDEDLFSIFKLAKSVESGRESVTTSPIADSAGTLNNTSMEVSSNNSPIKIQYFLNNDFTKQVARLQKGATILDFCNYIRSHGKALTDDFTVFYLDSDSNKLRVIKESSLLCSDELYYVIENSKVNNYSKVEKRVIKDLAAVPVSDRTGRPVYNSENTPLRVDFVPDDELYLNQPGRLGLTMCIGRKTKKSHHEWDRDLERDMDRLTNIYHCNVLVSLIRQNEMQTLKIPNLIEEVKRHGMQSIHFPILDKWIPGSMASVIGLVSAILQHLKSGKTVVIHCNGGKGRSGTIAVACLVAMGKKVSSAIEVVRKIRPGTIRNPMQIVYVKRFKTAYKAYAKKKCMTAMTHEDFQVPLIVSESWADDLLSDSSSESNMVQNQLEITQSDADKNRNKLNSADKNAQKNVR